jgi:hypothetical protein
MKMRYVCFERLVASLSYHKQTMGAEDRDEYDRNPYRARVSDYDSELSEEYVGALMYFC